MKGKVIAIDKSKGIIEPFGTKRKLKFTKNSLVGTSLDKLSIGAIVEFQDVSSDFNEEASYVRKAPLEWVKGIIESEVITSWGERQLNIVTSYGKRKFWFIDSKNKYLEEHFDVGDKVLFQYEGYYEQRNQAYNVTKFNFGYITKYNDKIGEGEIDFNYKFNKYMVNNFEEINIDTSKFFYLVSYEIYDGACCNIKVWDAVPEIIFDEQSKWLDGSIKQIRKSKEFEEYMVISSKDSPCSFKTEINNWDDACDRKWMKTEQHVSFELNEDSLPEKISWVGYITRFPFNPATKDMSAQINENIWSNDLESANPELLYFRKYKIINGKYDNDQRNFWVEAIIFGEKIRIPIKTHKTNLRFKVRYVITDDIVYKRKAKKIFIIGVAKAPETSMINYKEVNEDNNITINNYYAPIYNQFNIVKNVFNFEHNLFVENFYNIFKNVKDTVKKDENPIDVFHKTVTDEAAEQLRLDAHPEQLFKENYDAAIKRFEDSPINLPISDKSFEWLSEKSKLYLQTAIVIDYKLMDEKCIIADMSAQSVFYGKFLEQLLKDVLYPIFRKDTILSKKLVKILPNGKKVVCKVEETTIGTYCVIIRDNMKTISALFMAENTGDNEPKTNFWINLKEMLFEAKDIRNKTDHASDNISYEDVCRIRELLLKKNGIVDLIGKVFQANKLTVKKDSFDSDNKVEKSSDNSLEYMIYKNTSYSKSGKINGIIGDIKDKTARLYIGEISNSFIKQEDIKRFIEIIKEEGLMVKIISETECAYTVTLIDVSPDFKAIITR